MAINLGRYSFRGTIASIDKLEDKSDVYAIVCKVDTEYFLIDVDESSKLRTIIENHDKKDCWTENRNDQLTIYVHYTTFLKQQGRILTEKELRELFHPDCKIDKKTFPHKFSIDHFSGRFSIWPLYILICVNHINHLRNCVTLSRLGYPIFVS